jgi:hypothetical protein
MISSCICDKELNEMESVLLPATYPKENIQYRRGTIFQSGSASPNLDPLVQLKDRPLLTDIPKAFHKIMPNFIYEYIQGNIMNVISSNYVLWKSGVY